MHTHMHTHTHTHTNADTHVHMYSHILMEGICNIYNDKGMNDMIYTAVLER